MKLDPFASVRAALPWVRPPAARRRRAPRPDAPTTILPVIERPSGDLSPARIDAARDRLRAAIPPREEDA